MAGVSEVRSRSFVVYVRVSTQEQGRNGYSLDAQEKGCKAYCSPIGEVAGVFADRCSGSKTSRPGLDAALALVKSLGASLVIWDLDRLGRSIGHLMEIRDSGIEVHVSRMGRVLGTVEWGLFATLAQDERERISRRVKEGMREKKAQGGSVGGGLKLCKNSEEMNIDRAVPASVKARKEQARMRTAEPANVIRVLHSRGMGLSAIARELEAFQLPTPKGGKWTAARVRQLMALHGIGQESIEEEKAGEGSGVGETS